MEPRKVRRERVKMSVAIVRDMAVTKTANQVTARCRISLRTVRPLYLHRTSSHGPRERRKVLESEKLPVRLQHPSCFLQGLAKLGKRLMRMCLKLCTANQGVQLGARR